MIAIANAIVLLLSSVLFSVLYIASVRPAAAARRIGDRAWGRSKRLRIWASVFEVIVLACYVLYHYYPLDTPLAPRLPWPYSVSIGLAVLIGVPSIWVMLRGVRDAGEEALTPRPEHTMYGGIYDKIRHPQALGEAFLFPAAALILDSAHLSLYSLLWLPVFYLFCVMEERDLLLRYGDAYREYMEQTGMFLPKVSRRAA